MILSSLSWSNPKMLQSVAITAGTGKSHTLFALGHTAVVTSLRVRYFTAAVLVETLYRQADRADRRGAS